MRENMVAAHSFRIMRLILLVYLCFFLLPTTIIYRVQAAYLFFEPEHASVKKGKQVEVKIRINSEAESPTTVDAVVLFNSSQLRLIEVKEASLADRFFPKLFKRISNNKVFVGGAIEPGTQPKSGEGTIGVLVFEGTTPSENVVTFLCDQGKTIDSNINLKKNNKVVDVMNCSKVNQAAITVTGTADEPLPTAGGRGGGTASPTPSLTPSALASPTVTPPSGGSPLTTPTHTPTPATISATLTPTIPVPSQLPISGSIEGIKSAVTYGLVFVGVSLVIRLFLKL